MPIRDRSASIAAQPTPREGLRDLLDHILVVLQGPALCPAAAGNPYFVESRALPLGRGALDQRGLAVEPVVRASGSASDSAAVADTDVDVDEDHQQMWQLVIAAQGGDGDAFGQIYDRYVDVVYRFIFYRINDRALAEDFTSETFLRALRRIATITYQGRDIGAWLVTIARNIVFDHMKSARNRLEVTTGETVESRDVAPSPESTVIDALTSDKLISGVKQLNDEQRQCVELRFIQGLSVSETAAAMGKNDGAIKALQHRAVRKLADLIGNDLR